MKVKCRYCKKEFNRKCSFLKTTINPNKDRKCENYEFDEYKEIAELERRAKVLDDQEKAYKRREALLKKLKEAEASEKKAEPVTNNAHPITGDLSRFKSSVN
jgi:predicted ribosome quality control (RQC) complex YloA/Tae2 family protein